MTLSGRKITHYEIVEQLGGGGMGVVYRAVDTRLDRPVALKFLPPELSRDEEANVRFMQEAKAASALDHPNICTIFEVGESEESQLFIAMALYEGQTLKYRLKSDSLSRDDALRIARQIAEGLNAAHSKGIVHRDIKPANIMALDDGLVKILDFGLAKLPGVLSLTKTGSTVGTAAYMSPEQIRGVEVDGRTDLWSLGVVLFQMLTGELPFAGEYEQAVSYSIVNSEVKQPPEVDSDTWEVLAKLLAKDPGDRFQSADEAAAAIGVLLESGSGFVSQTATSDRLISKPMAIAAAIILAIATGVSLFSRFSGSAEVEADIDEDVIVVLPFTVRGEPDIEYLGEGMVDLLSVKLDGAGEIRTVDPNAVFGVITKDELTLDTPADGVSLANRLGAGRAIVGSVTQAGAQLQISAAVYESQDVPQLETAVQVGTVEQVSNAVDQLARQVIGGLLVDPDWQHASMASIATESFPALKAYLQGTALLRKSRWEESAELFREAVTLDSTFALAWNSLGWAYGWLADPRESEALEAAMRHSGSLPPRLRTLIEAHNYAFNVGDFDKAQELYLSVLANYPNDVRALNDMGEMVHHYNPMRGRPASEADQYFVRATELAPDNSDYLSHIYDAALDEWDFNATDSLALLDREIGGRDDIWEWVQTMKSIYRRPPEDTSWTFTDSGTMNTQLVSHLWYKAATHVEDLEAAEKIAEFMLEPGRYPANARERMSLRLAFTRAGRGQIARFGSDIVGSGPFGRSRVMVSKAILYGLGLYPVADEDVEDLIDEIGSWNPASEPLQKASGEVLYENDSDVVKAYLTALLANRIGDKDLYGASRGLLSRRADGSTGKDLAFSALRALEAIEYVQSGDFDAAVEAVDEGRLRIFWRDAAESLLNEQILDRFVKAEALAGRGDLEEAITVYRSITGADRWGGLLYIGPAYLRVADAYEQLGDIEEAIEFYSRFVWMWRECDAELIPIREEAQANLERLLRRSVSEPVG